MPFVYSIRVVKKNVYFEIIFIGTTSFSRTDSQVLLDINSANDININDINIILCTSTFEHEALHFLRMSVISFIFAAIIFQKHHHLTGASI